MHGQRDPDSTSPADSFMSREQNASRLAQSSSSLGLNTARARYRPLIFYMLDGAVRSRLECAEWEALQRNVFAVGIFVGRDSLMKRASLGIAVKDQVSCRVRSLN